MVAMAMITSIDIARIGYQNYSFTLLLSGLICFLRFKPFFCDKIYRAGGSEFAVYIRISALQTFTAKIYMVFHAGIICISIRMIDTCAHFK